jgi:hypothetical protein
MSLRKLCELLIAVKVYKDGEFKKGSTIGVILQGDVSVVSVYVKNHFVTSRGLHHAVW